jgi:dihydroorotase
MSKFLAMGVPLEDVIRRSTWNPAREINRPDLGTLAKGRAADIAVLEVLHGKFGYIDDGFARMNGNVQLLSRMTIVGGRILYDPSGLSMVEWTKAPKQYFTSPKLGNDPPSRADNYPRQ